MLINFCHSQTLSALTPNKWKLFTGVLQTLQDALIMIPGREVWVIGNSSLERDETPGWLDATSGFEEHYGDGEYVGETHWSEEKTAHGGAIFLLRYSILLKEDYDQEQMQSDYFRDRAIILDEKFQRFFSWESSPPLLSANAFDPYVFDLFDGGQDVFLTKNALGYIENQGVYSSTEP